MIRLIKPPKINNMDFAVSDMRIYVSYPNLCPILRKQIGVSVLHGGQSTSVTFTASPIVEEIVVPSRKLANIGHNKIIKWLDRPPFSRRCTRKSVVIIVHGGTSPKMSILLCITNFGSLIVMTQALSRYLSSSIDHIILTLLRGTFGSLPSSSTLIFSISGYVKCGGN